MKDHISRKDALYNLELIDWYSINDDGRLVTGTASETDAYVSYKAAEGAHGLPAYRVVCSQCGRRSPS